MKKTYHLCLSAGNEVLFRDREDFNRGFNCFALALYKTDSTGLVESFMSNHFHLIVQTENPSAFMQAMRMPYSKYFNHKYSRTGILGNRHHFFLEIDGLYHTLAAMSYVLRNALHHGVASMPYGYPHSSVNSIFRQEMGKSNNEKLLSPRHIHRFIGKRTEYPSHYKMDVNGIFTRESVLDIPQVEHYYSTPRAFDYYMNRKSGEEWEKEQEKDKSCKQPVNLSIIETGNYLQTTEKMLALESGRGNYRRLSDTDLCTLIDRQIISEYGKTSIYLLSLAEKKQIAERLYRQHHAPAEQIKRCLVMP